jgi:hypothetical protein
MDLLVFLVVVVLGVWLLIFFEIHDRTLDAAPLPLLSGPPVNISFCAVESANQNK